MVILVLAVLAAPLVANAQQPAKVPRIGFLGATSEAGQRPQVEAFRQGLRDLGYVEGQNLIVEFRWARGQYERLPALAAELVGLPVDLLVTHGTPGTWAAKRTTTTMPIVMAISGDAVASGLVASLPRPGGNITGSTYFSPEVSAKGLELLKEALPLIRHVAVLVNPDNPQVTGPAVQAIARIAGSLKLELHPFEARGPSEFESVFAAMAKQRVDALVVADDSMLNDNRGGLAALGVKHRLPSTGIKTYAEAGGLIGYGVNFPEIFRRAAVFVDKILKGAKPADLPVEQATKFVLVLNLKTAKALGLTIPQSILIRADEVIR
jgi:putative ABC transport system substrate-binding protein